ncbi:MAG: hypothetical protein GX435_05085 [Exilispira sp.]|nr:hypothetical protein [Exilispira sp.]
MDDEEIKYMYMDGVNFKIRIRKSDRTTSIETIPMLIVIDVANNNRKKFLTIQMGDKDKAST